MAATTRVVDLTNVKEGGNFRPRRKKEGDYTAKIVKADDHTSKAGDQGWVLTVMVDGDGRSTYPYYLSTAEKQAWKINTVCAAAGLKVSGKRINFNPNKLVNKAVGIFLEDDEYEGREKSTIGDIFPVSEVGDAGDAPEGDEVYDDEDAVDTEDIEEEEVEEEEPAPAPRKRAAKKAAPKPPPVPVDEDDLEEEEVEYEDEEEEPEPTPPPRKRRATTPPTKAVAPARKVSRPKAAAPVEDEIDTDDLDDLDD